MMLIKELMMVSCEGDFYASRDLMDKFNLNARQLKEVMESMGFEQARKYVINENGEKVRVRGYVCVNPSTVAEETEEVNEPTKEEKEFKLEQYTYNQMISMSDLMKKLLVGEIRLHYEELVEYYQFAKDEVFNDFNYLNNSY